MPISQFLKPDRMPTPMYRNTYCLSPHLHGNGGGSVYSPIGVIKSRVSAAVASFPSIIAAGKGFSAPFCAHAISSESAARRIAVQLFAAAVKSGSTSRDKISEVSCSGDFRG